MKGCWLFMNEKLGDRIRSLRKSSNISQENLSEGTSISRSNISKIEAGTVSPSADALIAIARFFNVSTDFLLFGNPEEKSKDSTNRALISKQILSNEDEEILQLWHSLSYMNKAIIKGDMYKLKKEQSKENSDLYDKNFMVAE